MKLMTRIARIWNWWTKETGCICGHCKEDHHPIVKRCMIFTCDCEHFKDIEILARDNDGELGVQTLNSHRKGDDLW